MEFLCEVSEAQTAREVNSRMKCVTKIMAMPGTRTLVADLCMSGLAACDEENASVRTVINARQFGMWMQNECTGTHRHTRVGVRTTSEKREQTGTWVHQVGRAMEVQQELKMREQKKAKDAKRICGIVYENDKNKGTSHVQDDVVKLMHHDEKELLSLWEGRHWHEHKGGWLDPELCAKARRVEVGVHSSPQDAHQSSERDAHQDRMGGD